MCSGASRVRSPGTKTAEAVAPGWAPTSYDRLCSSRPDGQIQRTLDFGIRTTVLDQSLSERINVGSPHAHAKIPPSVVYVELWDCTLKRRWAK